MSEKSPPKTAFGAEPPNPHKNRKIKRAGKVGASAHAMVKIRYIEKVLRRTGFRPKCSLKGPNRAGPRKN